VRVARNEATVISRKPKVKIGFAAPFTGDQAIVGEPMRQCAELAIVQANARGNLPFDLILRSEDDRADPASAECVARGFVADTALVGVVGHKNSGPSAAAAPVYAKAALAQITPSSTNSRLSQQGYRTFFRLCAHDAIQGAVAARYAVQVLGARRVVVIHDQTDYGQPLAEVVRTTARQEGAEVVLFEGITEGAGDFTDTATRVQRVSPDLAYFALTEIESSILARQLRDAGVASILFGTDGSRESKFVSLAGPAAEGAYQTYAGADPESTPSAQHFIREFEARYGAVPVYGAEVYDATALLIAAVERAAASNRRRVLEEVTRTRDFPGVTGRINFDSNGERIDPNVSIWRVEGGEIRLLGSAHDLIAA
jgi:branched-chain amino acid transport system substrate-binding protein